MQDRDIVVPWLAINNTGQWFLLLLLITYASAHHLPQRNNAYLINFVLTAFLATIPPSLLFYSGYQFSSLPRNLCIIQFSLVVGVPPMFITAQLALVFDTWSELRSLCIHTPHISRNTYVKCIALIAPYLSLVVWTFAAFKAALPTAYYSLKTIPKIDFVYCRSSGDSSLLKGTSVFLALFMLVQVILEVWVAWMIYAYPSKVHDEPTVWRTSIQFSLRVIVLSFLQFLSVFLSILNDTPSFHSDSIKSAYELLDSMSALAVFLAIGTQTNVLRTWKDALLRLWAFITCKKHEEEDPDELQPHGYPGLDWAYVPSKTYPSEVAPFDGYPIDMNVDAAEKGKGARGGGGGVKQMLKTKMTFPKVALPFGRR